MKKTIRIVALLLALVLLTACGGSSTKTYTCREISMTVPSGMRDVSGQADFSSFTFALDSTKLAIFGLNETFSEYPVLEEYSTKDYADLVVEHYGVNGTAAQRSGKDYHYIIYTANTDMGEFTYMAGIFKNSNGFWMIQVCAPTKNYDQQTFFTYLDSVNVG